ncbi:MAG: CinA family protein [Lachnospiraceae bacterium]|nr:CinA family protein [Lachnospiraceae bacterium]
MDEENTELLAESVVRLLQEKKLLLSTVESCTGGAVAARIVDIPGASDVLIQGLVTYSNQAKHRLAGVNTETLEQWGAVSEQTAREMAAGGNKSGETDVCISTTGIAGPGGGTLEKPVGLVYIACDFQGKTQVRELHLTGNRMDIRKKTVIQALELIRACVSSCA